MIATVILQGVYDYRLVALSVLIGVLAAYAALDLAGRVTSAHGGTRLPWLVGGSVAMGIGIWAIHYIGMESFDLPVPVQYDWPTVLLSLVAAVFASGVALSLVGRSTMGPLRAIGGGIFMGGGIAAMHYIGMDAMRLSARRVYSPGLVLLSIVLMIVISFISLQVAVALKGKLASSSGIKFGCALIVGVAIPAMQYVDMAATSFITAPSVRGGLEHAVSISRLGPISIAVITLLILGLIFLTSMMDRRLSHQAQQLADSRLQLQAIFDNMTEGIVVLDQDRNVVQMNRAASHLFGLPGHAQSHEDFVQSVEFFLPNGELLPPQSWPRIRALRGDFVRNYEVELRRKDTGKAVIVESSTAPIANRSGEILQIIVTYRDITERKQIDQARMRLAAIVESSEDAIIGKDDRGIVTSWNKGAENVFGYAAGEMIGQSISRLLPPGSEQEDKILNRIKAGETVEYADTVRKRKDGRMIHVSLTVSPIRDAAGRVVGASSIARDITEKRQLERQLHQSQKMEAIGQLTGGIAHDFNNLLGVIVGNLDLLERRVSDDPVSIKRVQTAQKAAARGADLTRRLLAFSSKEELNPSAIVLEDSIRNMIELAARALGPEIKITTHFDTSIPPVSVDAAGLESALLNLVVNARDAMPKGGSLTITTLRSILEDSYLPVQTGELKAGTYACVEISDTGEGMSRETLERAFEPFFTTKPRTKGTGLGLAMVYGFVKQSGGTTRIYSEPGYGTTVSLYLPFAEGRAQPARAIGKEILPAAQGGTVLIVDDEVELLEIAVVYLTEMGYTALQAKDGASALEIVAQRKDIALMMTDIIMPGGMNGVELAQKVCQLNPAIKIIYTSGFPADALAEKSGSLVGGPLLHKPYQRAEFAAILRSVMEGPMGSWKNESSPDPGESLKID